MGRSKENQREFVATKPGMKTTPVKGPQVNDGRNRIRPGTYDVKTKPAWDGPSVILKECDD